MKSNYQDIRQRIKEPPTWYDENGVPRYGKFAPDSSPNIYADTVVLMLIRCQACRQRFHVEMNWGTFHSHRLAAKGLPHYGDPPIHGCGGDTMNCEDIKVLQHWTRAKKTRWKRLL